MILLGVTRRDQLVCLVHSVTQDFSLVVTLESLTSHVSRGAGEGSLLGEDKGRHLRGYLKFEDLLIS